MKTQICKNCAYYTAYFKQLAYGYGSLNHAFCSKHQSAQKQFEVCKDFKAASKKKLKLRLEYLDRALKAITEIAQILKEKSNE